MQKKYCLFHFGFVIKVCSQKMVIAFICIFSHSIEVSITFFATCLQHVIWENPQYTAGHDGTPCSTFFSLFRKRVRVSFSPSPLPPDKKIGSVNRCLFPLSLQPSYPPPNAVSSIKDCYFVWTIRMYYDVCKYRRRNRTKKSFSSCLPLSIFDAIRLDHTCTFTGAVPNFPCAILTRKQA